MDIKQFGAVGDGIHDDHTAIQNALENSQGLISIPPGTYKIGKTIRIPSNMHIKASPEAHLFLADGAGVDSQSFLITNSIHADGNTNIQIEGGIWDGNTLNNPRGPDEPGSYTGAILNIINVAGFCMKNMVFRDAEAYFTRLSVISDFEISDIRFEAENLRPNQDGIHIAGNSHSGLIRNIVGIGTSTNDDLVTLSPDDALSRAQNLDLSCGPIRNIRIENLKAESCHTFVRLLSVHNPVSDITIDNVEGGCRCMALNLDGCRECRVKLFDPEDPKYKNGVGDISNIRISNFRVHKSSATDNTPLINIRTNVHDFVIEDFHRDSDKDINPDAHTINFSDCRASQVVLDGADCEQIATLQKSGGVHGGIIEQGPTPQDQGFYHCQFELEQQSNLKLTQGGFSSLVINNPQAAKESQ